MATGGSHRRSEAEHAAPPEPHAPCVSRRRRRTQVAHPDTGLINKNVPAGTFQDPAAEPPAFGQQPADALALLAETALHHGIDPGTPGERYQVVVHVDAPVLAESDALADPAASGQSLLEAGAHVSAETSRRLACDATRVVMSTTQRVR
ncbi:MAG: hypothetical protein DMD76_13465 [Candidatus Rokuibacteriota bacterium]|nr:MAG: hypothetical protein DMD76_13465 [Candidatus Rokubacteria bacterium]